jgi:hypothetical protein
MCAYIYRPGERERERERVGGGELVFVSMKWLTNKRTGPNRTQLRA